MGSSNHNSACYRDVEISFNAISMTLFICLLQFRFQSELKSIRWSDTLMMRMITLLAPMAMSAQKGFSKTDSQFCLNLGNVAAVAATTSTTTQRQQRRRKNVRKQIVRRRRRRKLKLATTTPPRLNHKSMT